MIEPRDVIGALGRRDRRDWPAIGPLVPGYAVRLLMLILGVALSITAFAPVLLIVVGGLIAVTAAVLPRTMAAWWLIVVLGLSQFRYDDPALRWQFFLLLAGVHLLHVLGTQTLTTPLLGWTQLAVFRAPLLRFIAIQLPVQTIAVAVLLLFYRDDGTARVSVAALGTIGALAVLGLVLFLAVPLLRKPT